MVYNRANASFPQWMEQIKTIATEEYNFELGYSFNENDFWDYYDKGMDVHEAIITHQEN